ncbi:SubName: Full=Uncharacterized protein {ECO:0000313/EMBL:CCA66833.1} [Serendipita indica DSM 11827]|uniref:DUF6699 domain-containing protein n=1 Tax=Serendipita indica (strain DSM 11827) TaxID=1109443 RepID=G4T6B2_SERID|nr:SubName: Full=Uncharacterized protein {ECO:0000313/EMBL:CCA66833.1} [Serendipita indica DSM 11827]CCA66833.1 hypothetical protein PIIN_00595 [Serendipita indica DSM 11827]
MAWNSPNTVIPNLPYGVSPAHVPIPLTPVNPGQGLPGQAMGGGYYIQQQQPVQQGYAGNPSYLTYGLPPPQYLQVQPQMPGYVQNVQNPPGMYLPYQRSKAREDNPPLDPFLDGDNYGPVLDVMTATILGIKLKLNPILQHMIERNEDDPRLVWDVLESPKEAHLVEGTKSKPWASRDSTASLPRMNRLYLVLNHTPGVIEIEGTGKGGAVTCADVVNGIQQFVKQKVPRATYEGLKPVKRAKIDAVYHANRSSKYGATGRDVGTGIRKGDLLEEWTVFDGLEDDPTEIRNLLGIGKPPKNAETDTPAARARQRPWVGHLILRLDHREGEDIPFEAPPEPVKIETPPSTTDEGDSEEEGSEEDEDEEPAGYNLRAARQPQVASGKKKGKGKGNIYGIPQGYAQMGMQPQMVYPGGMPVVYAQQQPVMHQPLMQQPVMQSPIMQQPVIQQQHVMQPGFHGQQQYLVPQGQQILPPGYVPAGTPAMTTYQLAQQQYPPPLGTPLPPPGRRL